MKFSTATNPSRSFGLDAEPPTASASSAVRPGIAVWGTAAWLASVGNFPLWERIASLGGSPVQQATLIGGLGALLLGAVAALLSLLAWPLLFRFSASVLILISALNTHFMREYGVVMDPTMLANVWQTDVHEVRDLMSWSIPGTILLVAGLPLWALWRRPVVPRRWVSQVGRNTVGALAGLSLVLVASLTSYQGLASLMRNHKELRYMANPLNTVYAGTRLAMDQLPRQRVALHPVGADAALGTSYAQQARSPLLVLVIGETARAQNFGLNGYSRQTTPALARWQAQDGLVNFSNVRSCGTNTLVSLPCMFSPLSQKQGGDQPPESENLLDVLSRAGLAVLWIDNQAGCKGVCERVPNGRANERPVQGLCEAGECLDEVMLNGLDARLAELDPARRARGTVIVMHQMGSHGPAYSHRSPKDRKPFLPECSSATLSDCPREQLVNAYDNSIAYTDHFLDKTLQWLKAHSNSGGADTGLIYVSDHGESLGENGLYLHGVPYSIAPEQQTHVPMVAWLSPGLRERLGLSLDCLRGRATNPISHDYFFHSVLGLMDLSTQAYQPEFDALAPCTTKYMKTLDASERKSSSHG